MGKANPLLLRPTARESVKFLGDGEPNGRSITTSRLAN